MTQRDNDPIHPTPTHRLLTAQEVAAQLGIGVQTLYNWRSTGAHPTPPAVKLGGAVRWRQSDVDRFIESLLEAA